MSGATKKKQFRSRAASDDEEEEQQPPAPKAGSTKPAGGAKKVTTGSSKDTKKASLLSFGDDEEETDEATQKALKARKAKASKEARKAMDLLEAERGEEAAGPAYGWSSGGEYTAEKLAALRKSQPFQLPSKPKKKSGGKVHFDPGMVPPEEDEPKDGGDPALDATAESGNGTQILDEAEVARLKQKKERSRRIAMEEFIPLRSGEEGEEEEAAGGGGRRRAGKGLAGDEERKTMMMAEGGGGEENLDEWEQEIIRRGARRTETAAVQQPGHAPPIRGPGGASAAPLSLFEPHSVTFKSVEEVLKDLTSTQNRVQEAHDRNVRAAEKAKAELEQLREGLDKMRKEFQHTGERFQYFQEVRDYVSSLCGCLREKEGMIKELDGAMATIRKEACTARWTRRIEAQEDELQSIKEQGVLSSLQGYEPRIKSLLGEEGGAASGEGGGVDRDEFGRDRTYSVNQAKEKRREARLARRRKALARVGLTLGHGDTEEAEANMTDADDSESEVEVSGRRKVKLVEAGDVIFEDADEDFRSINNVATHFETWKRTHHKDYVTAFVSLGLPQMFEPFVRLEMVRWEPLRNQVLGGGVGEASDASLENFHWYQKLFNYGAELNNGEDDPDDRLVPQLVERVAMVLLTQSLSEHYDPLSSVETSNAIAMLQQLLIYDPPKKALDALLKAPLSRLRECVATVCVPLLKPDGPSPETAVAFQRRQVFRAVKLYRNLCLWHEVISSAVLAPLALTDLLCKRLIKALDNRITYTTSQSPHQQLQGRSPALVESLGILHALANATPPKWILDKAAPLKDVHKLLERIDALLLGTGNNSGQVTDPLRQMTARLKDAFGGASSKKA